MDELLVPIYVDTKLEKKLKELGVDNYLEQSQFILKKVLVPENLLELNIEENLLNIYV